APCAACPGCGAETPRDRVASGPTAAAPSPRGPYLRLLIPTARRPDCSTASTASSPHRPKAGAPVSICWGYRRGVIALQRGSSACGATAHDLEFPVSAYHPATLRAVHKRGW